MDENNEKPKQRSDCWTYAGRIKMKTNEGLVKEIISAKDLDMY